MSEIVLTTREELQELITAAVNDAMSLYGTEHMKDTRSDDEESVSGEYYTVKQLARKWCVTLSTIWRHEKLGHIKAIRIGRRVLFPREQIDRMKSLKSAHRNIRADPSAIQKGHKRTNQSHTNNT